VRNLTKLLQTSFVTLMVAGCNLAPLQVDPCAVWPDDITQCRAIPLNQPDKAPYDRPIGAGDICVLATEYSEIQKHYREVLRLCGDRCK
jgi:hypothetical protein